MEQGALPGLQELEPQLGQVLVLVLQPVQEEPELQQGQVVSAD